MELNNLETYFHEVLVNTWMNELGLLGTDPTIEYLQQVMGKFITMDQMTLESKAGEHIIRVAEMVEEGDIRCKADSFVREREVHKHIGDLLLFWSGLFPAYRTHLRVGSDLLLDPVGQGRQSYSIASSFKHQPY